MHPCRSSHARPTRPAVQKQVDVTIRLTESTRAPNRKGERRDWWSLMRAVVPTRGRELEAPALHVILRGLGQPKGWPLQDSCLSPTLESGPVESGSPVL